MNGMEIKQPLLSICIPTYNRKEQIQKQVRLLLPQLNSSVELIVYDNFSDVPVAQLFTERELSQFTLMRNSTNIGADANIARCFENCETKWLWTLSDDDWVTKNAVDIILNEIDKRSDAIFLNMWNRENIEIDNFDDLIRLYRSSPVFSFSFAMSFCVYNIHKLKPYLRFYYENLSSMVGSLILVLKYAEKYPDSKLCWVNKSCISLFDSEVSWNYAKYIYQSRLFIYAFNPKNEKLYRKTLFRGYFITNYYLIGDNRKSSNVDLCGRFRLFWLSIKTQGFFEMLSSNSMIVFRLLGVLILEALGLYNIALKIRKLLISKPIPSRDNRYHTL